MTELLTRVEDQVRPEHTALLVIDMQNDFCAEGGYIDKVVKADLSGCTGVATAINKLVDTAREAGVSIVWIRANYELRYLAEPMQARNAARDPSSSVCCAGGTWGYDFWRMTPRDGEFFVEKHRYDAFLGTPLDDILRHNGIRTLITTGVVTNVCVESTLRAGFFRGYYIVVPEDAVGSSHKDLHDATLKNVSMYYGTVTDADALCALWRGAAKSGLRKAG
jgi:ureidoacrylate peracid hydrolase